MLRYILLVTLCLLTKASAAEPLQMGVAVRDITPPVGYRMSGYFYERPSTGTHDPLHAKAIVLQQGDNRAALVFCDLIGISRTVSDAVRQQASERTKIPTENILIAATHSHTGPLYGGVLRQQFHNQAIARNGKDPAEALIDYPAWLANRIVDAIASAQAKAAETRIDFATTDVAGLSFNRRFHMKDGSVRFNPGRKNPDIVRVAGPIDPALSLLTFTQGKQDIVAHLHLFALHLDTVGGTEYSADFPQYLGMPGSKTVSIFAAGTCGDINHIDVTQADQPKGQAMAQHIGRTLNESAERATQSARRLEPSLAVRSSVVQVPLQQYPEEAITKARANMSKIGGKQLSFLEQVEACKIVALQTRTDEHVPLDVQAFRISDDVALVGLPGEVFVELGLAIKDRSPFKHTLVIELCNDSPAYIPTKKAFAEGSYETVNSLIQPGGGEMLVEEALRLLEKLK